MNAIEARGLGRRYGSRWGLRDLDLTIPEHAVVGLVGPNGAGKSTLLHLATGLIAPTEGTIEVLGESAGAEGVLPDVAFVAQDAPLPRRVRLRELLNIARRLNVRWDADIVMERMRTLGLDLDRRIGDLSGGERAQVALATALAKQPRLLLLDEPVASLDPLARRSFLQTLMSAVAEVELTVVFSTHLLDDLQRTCDHLVVLGRGSRHLSGSIDEIVAGHSVLVGPPGRPLPHAATLVGDDHHPRGHQHLVSLDRPIFDPEWVQITPSLEEIVLAYLDTGRNRMRPAVTPRLEAV